MRLTGIGVGRAVTTGPVQRMPDPLPEPSAEATHGDPDGEIGRARAAMRDVAADLLQRGGRAGGPGRDVLEAQALMAEDPTLVDDVVARIRRGRTAERAVHEAFQGFQATLVGLGGYLAERAGDLGDVAQRVVARLSGVAAPGVPQSDVPFVLVARDLAPADTVLLDLDKVLGLITRGGGPTSHTAILARARAIPAVVGVEGAEGLRDGQVVVVDAGAGAVDVDPAPAAIAEAEGRRAAQRAAATAPVTPGALADGTRVELLANLGGGVGAVEASDLGAEGIGLLRTEFLFLDATAAPTAQHQREQYGRLLGAFSGRKVVVRALDAGSDKPLRFLTDGVEQNPALGLRGLRALRAHEEVLRAQLSALADAAADTGADVRVMAPMVSEPEEARWFTALARELGIRTAGVMIEVPSSALLAPQILESADFVSIGTNDLTQYTLAADRLLDTVAGFQDPWHPAVLRLIAEVGAAGRSAGKEVAVCGEAAADPALAVVLVGLGVSSLSMTPTALADVRAELLTVTLPEARARAAAALTASSAAEARAAAALAASRA